MSEYTEEINDMRWSYSRISTFARCKYSFYKKYIEEAFAEKNFYSESGSYMHEILEKVFKKEMTLDEASEYFVDYFEDNVCYKVKQSIINKTFEQCADYLATVDFDWLNDYEILGVELEVEVEVDGYPFVGYIDLLIRHKESGDIFVVDHKSSAYPFLKDGVSVSKKCQSDFASYKKQMYLYSKAVYEKYGVYPKQLWWNHFKEKKYAKIDFVEEDYLEALKWFVDEIHAIEVEEKFEPTREFFYCTNLCDCRNDCEYK